MKRLTFLILLLAVSIGTANSQTGTKTTTQTNSSDYTFLVASGFLCSSGNAGVCPAVARSANGDAFELSGAGMFNPYDKSAKAFGVFNHKSASGDLIETGVWYVDRLVSFESYGIAPAALAQWGPAVGRPRFGLRRPGPQGRTPSGGLAVFHILLMPVSGTTKTAELKVNCALGIVPQEHSVEGIGITLDKENIEYAEEAGSRVIFLTGAHDVRVPVQPADEKAKIDPSAEGKNTASE